MAQYRLLAECLLPAHMLDWFDLKNVRVEKKVGTQVIHLYLGENEQKPDDREDLRPNGFTRESVFHDFPIRGQEVLLHVRRRRWLDAHGRKGCLIAVVKCTKAKDVIKALMKIPEALRMSVEEVTLDFSESMHNIVETCIPKAMRTLDQFHHQQFCLEALQEVRREYRLEQMTLDANAREEHRLMMRQLQENDGPFVDEEGNAIRRNARYYPERLENG